MSKVDISINNFFEHFHMEGIMTKGYPFSFSPTDCWRVPTSQKYMVQPVTGKGYMCILLINPGKSDNKLSVRQIDIDDLDFNIEEAINRDDELLVHINEWYPGMYKCWLSFSEDQTAWIYILDMLSGYRRVKNDLGVWGMPLEDERLRIKNLSYVPFKQRVTYLYQKNKDLMQTQYDESYILRVRFLPSCGIIEPTDKEGKLVIPENASPLIFNGLYHNGGNKMTDVFREFTEVTQMLLTAMSMRYTYATKQTSLLIRKPL